MSSTGHRLFSGLALFRTCRGIFLNGGQTMPRHPLSVRTLAVSRTLCERSKKLTEDDDDEPAPEPIKFSTSKASHRVWSVDRSFGSSYQRPWWRVLPISVVGIVFLLWCVFRKESETDKKLEKELYEHLPALLSDEEEAVKPR